MIELLGEGLEKAFDALNIDAKLKYKSSVEEDCLRLEVWEISEKDYERLCEMPMSDWDYDWGWWRHGFCIYQGTQLKEYNVNGQKMLGYINLEVLELVKMLGLNVFDEDNNEDLELDEEQDYDSFLEWLHEVFNLGTISNLSYFAYSLAKDNNMSLSEFMKKYQP